MCRTFVNRFFCILLFTLLCSRTVVSQSLRQLTVEDGLASSSVTAVHQSSDGMLWFGTLDGMNIYYGDKVRRTMMNPYMALEGYLIEEIVETSQNNMWIRTPHEVYKLARLTREVVSFPQFTGGCKLRVVGDDQVMVLDVDHKLYLYETDENRFETVDVSFGDEDEILDLGGTELFVWTAGKKGIYRYNWSARNGAVSLERAVCLTDDEVKFSQLTDDQELLYYLDAKNHLYSLDIRQNEKTFILDLNDELKLRGIPSCIVESNGSYFISFKVGGVMKIAFDSATRQWTKTDLGIKSGVFDLFKDQFQDLIWIATDGQGVYAYWEEDYNIRSYCYRDFSFDLGRPVRALYLDDEDWLWIGTKGEGLIGFDRKDKSKEIHLVSRRTLTTHNSALEDNAVYTMAASGYNGFWVGTEGGLNFYDYTSRSLQTVEAGKEIKYVHSIQEVGDSVLWIATVGKGVFKANITPKGNRMKLDNIRRFEVGGGQLSSNYFFAMHYSEQGDLWLGNRGYGVFKMYPYGLEPSTWPNKRYSQLQDDVFALYDHKDILWVGTGCGLVGMSEDGKDMFLSTEDGLPSNIVRSLQVDEKGMLWIATNNGLARLDENFANVNSYGRRDGLRVTEFSDGATFRTDNTLYFGGVNGWVEVSDNAGYKPSEGYVPPLYFVYLEGVKNKDMSLHLLALNTEDGQIPRIEFGRDENAFTISYMAMDYINSGDYQYFYKIESDSKSDWMDNGSHTFISLSQLLPDEYTLSVKYRNRVTGYESQPVRLEICIKPYWWQTTFMKTVYWLCFLLGITFVVLTHNRQVKRRHKYVLQAMERRHKDELYEEKLRFFTNITHEFSTPLTLIYSPCERILSHQGTDDFVRRYVLLIKKHTERLYQLIQEVIDYRRIETKHQQLNLESYNLSAYIDDVCMAFQDFAEKNGIALEKEVDPDIYWNMDRRTFPKIASNLLSNAIKYTPRGGIIKVGLAKLSDNELQFKVYNTGKGIKEEDRLRIFNRYSVLDEVEEDASKILSRNGLGMAICHSSVQLLGGKIEIISEVGKYAEFIVTLPLLPLTETNEQAGSKEVISLGMQNWETSVQFPIDHQEVLMEESVGEVSKLPSGNRPMILVVDDNKDILFLLREVFSATYDVQTAHSADEALEHIRMAVPDLIITDVMMPGTDGKVLTRQIKQNKHTMHIPLIILSARNTDEAKAEGLQAGADAYIGKPFNVHYLEAVVQRLIESRRNMREYYNTSASAYEFVEGQLIKAEDRDFLASLNEVIERNLSNGSLTTEMIAGEMNISSRSLYRRLKELNLPSPKDYVRERKMEKAVKLLQTTDMSIQEVIFDCGFNNRAHFYKDFSKRFGCTPKEFRSMKKKTDHLLGGK